MLRTRDRSRGGNGSGGGATASFNFQSATLPAGMTFTRSTVATDLVNGVLTDFAIDAPRISTFNGYLPESARTNSIRNGEAQGSVAGSPGTLPTNWNDVNTVGLTRTIVGAGTINGFNYLDIRLSGTPTAGTYNLLMESATQIAAASGQTWSGQFYIGLIGGSLTGITSTACRVSGRLAGVETEGTSQTITPTIDPTRVFAIRTLNGGTTAQVVSQLDVVVTAVPIDATFRIAAAQLEQGYGASSYIRTNTVAVSRGADSLSKTTASISGFSATAGTLVVSGKTPAFYNSNGDQHLVAISAAQLNGENEIQISRAAFNSRKIQMKGRVGYASIGDIKSVVNLNDGTNFKVAAAWDATNTGLSLSAASTVSGSFTSVPPSINTLYIGRSFDAGVDFFGYITTVDYYNTRKTNAELQVLSA